MLSVLAACVFYAATITLGTLSIRGRRVRRVWHTRLFVGTVLVTAGASLLSLPHDWPRAGVLALALAPLLLLPFITTPVARHPRRHALVGLSAAPCYLTAIVLAAAHAN